MNPDKPDYEILFDQIAEEAMVIVKSASRIDNPYDRACTMKGSLAKLTELIGKIQVVVHASPRPRRPSSEAARPGDAKTGPSRMTGDAVGIIDSGQTGFHAGLVFSRKTMLSEKSAKKIYNRNMKNKSNDLLFKLKHPTLNFICECCAAVVFVATIFAFIWLCCIASGYHWE